MVAEVKESQGKWKTQVSFRDLIALYDCNADNELKEIKRVVPFWIKRFETIADLKVFIPTLKKIKLDLVSGLIMFIIIVMSTKYG